jgi:dynein heavy chain, axonemal
MPALAYPNTDGDDEEIRNSNVIKSQLLPGLRSFCSALRVCEEVCKQKNIFDDGIDMFSKVPKIEDVKKMIKDKGFVIEIENRVTDWIKGVAQVRLKQTFFFEGTNITICLSAPHRK